MIEEMHGAVVKERKILVGHPTREGAVDEWMGIKRTLNRKISLPPPLQQVRLDRAHLEMMGKAPRTCQAL